MSCDAIQGVCYRCERRHCPDVATRADLLQCQFTVDAPDRISFAEIIQHCAPDGWVYFCDVMDAWNRRTFGWSLADRVHADLSVDTPSMVRWQLSPSCTIMYPGKNTHWTSWVFLHRCARPTCLDPSDVASSVESALIEAFWSTMQRKLLNRARWGSSVKPAIATLEQIEGHYTPRCRRTAVGVVSPRDFYFLHTAAHTGARAAYLGCPGKRVRLPHAPSRSACPRVNSRSRNRARGGANSPQGTGDFPKKTYIPDVRGLIL